MLRMEGLQELATEPPVKPARLHPQAVPLSLHPWDAPCTSYSLYPQYALSESVPSGCTP